MVFEQDFRLTKIYDDWILKKTKENNEKRKEYDPTWFHCSSVSTYRCALELFWQVKANASTVFPLNVLKIFEMGNSVHTRIQTAFKEMGILLPEDEEKKFYIPEYNICGRTDGIVSFLPRKEGEEFVLEIKSISSSGYDKLNQPKKEHVIQNMIYQKGFNLPWGEVYYENKNTQDQKGFIIPYNEEYIKSRLDDCKMVKGLLEGEKLSEDFKCRMINCSYKPFCNSEFFKREELKLEKESDTIGYEDILPQEDEGDVF